MVLYYVFLLQVEIFHISDHSCYYCSFSYFFIYYYFGWKKKNNGRLRQVKLRRNNHLQLFLSVYFNINIHCCVYIIFSTFIIFIHSFLTDFCYFVIFLNRNQVLELNTINNSENWAYFLSFFKCKNIIKFLFFYPIHRLKNHTYTIWFYVIYEAFTANDIRFHFNLSKIWLFFFRFFQMNKWKCVSFRINEFQQRKIPTK